MVERAACFRQGEAAAGELHLVRWVSVRMMTMGVDERSAVQRQQSAGRHGAAIASEASGLGSGSKERGW